MWRINITHKNQSTINSWLVYKSKILIDYFWFPVAQGSLHAKVPVEHTKVFPSSLKYPL